MTADGEVLGVSRIPAQPFELMQALAVAGPEPEVVMESTYGWYWAADVLAEMGARVHLAHALGNNWGNRRVKNEPPQVLCRIFLSWKDACHATKDRCEGQGALCAPGA